MLRPTKTCSNTVFGILIQLNNNILQLNKDWATEYRMPVLLQTLYVSSKHCNHSMVQEFEVMNVFDHHNRGQFIFARQVNFGQSFEVKEGSLLSGIPIYHYVDMPRMLDENGQPQLNVFVFRPLSLNKFPADYFLEAQIAELIVP